MRTESYSNRMGECDGESIRKKERKKERESGAVDVRRGMPQRG